MTPLYCRPWIPLFFLSSSRPLAYGDDTKSNLHEQWIVEPRRSSLSRVFLQPAVVQLLIDCTTFGRCAGGFQMSPMKITRLHWQVPGSVDAMARRERFSWNSICNETGIRAVESPKRWGRMLVPDPNSSYSLGAPF
jgi:hypothetical protein